MKDVPGYVSGQPITFTLFGKEVAVPFDRETEREVRWSGDGWYVHHWKAGCTYYDPAGSYDISVDAPCYDDSNPCGKAVTVADAAKELEESLLQWMDFLTGLGVKQRAVP